MPVNDEQATGALAFDLMRDLVNITGEKWVGAGRFTALADRCGAIEVPIRIVFLTGVTRLLRTIPVQVFTDPEIRLSILHAAQEALDQAIDREEEQE